MEPCNLQKTLMRNPRSIPSLTLLMLACLMPPLFAGSVKAYAAPKADFARYRSYRWLPPRVLTKLGVDENHPAAPVLKEVVGRQLSQRGLNEVADSADLQIQAYLLTESVPQLEAVFFSTIVVSQGDVVAVGGPITTIGRYNKQGSLYINLIDSLTKQSAWLAMVSDSLPNRDLRPEEIRAKLDKAATNIFKKYPVKKK